MLGKPRILTLFPTRLINVIKHELSCKIFYVNNEIKTYQRDWEMAKVLIIAIIVERKTRKQANMQHV